MIYAVGDVTPQVHETVFIAPSASVIGDVVLAANTSVWFNATLRGDVAPIRIGARSNVQDGAVLHVDPDTPCLIGDDMTIGHGAIVHGMFVGQGSLVGMGATLLGRTKIGRGCLVAAGAVVPPGLEVPDGMAVMGVPGKIVRPVKDEERKYMQWLSAHYVELARKYVAGADPRVRAK